MTQQVDLNEVRNHVISPLGNRFQQLPTYQGVPLFYQQPLKTRLLLTHSDQRNLVFTESAGYNEVFS